MSGIYRQCSVLHQNLVIIFRHKVPSKVVDEIVLPPPPITNPRPRRKSRGENDSPARRK